MKIVAIETHVCNARMRNWIFVKVITDQDGLYGWGEATLEWHTLEVLAAIDSLKPLLIGEDPTRIEHLWQSMIRQHFWHGTGAVRGTAIAGIDLALWDILGKVSGLPVHRLFGGPVRDFVRLYSHLGGGKMEDFYQVDPADATRFAELAQKAVEDGFTAFKTMAVPETHTLEGLQPVRYAEKCVAAMREAVGDGIDIMVDCHARPSPRMGHLFAKAIEPYGLYWFEEPCWPEYMDEIASIQRSVVTPIATGERLTSFWAFREMAEKRAASVWQPDITHSGGLTAVRKIAALAESVGAAIAPHNPQGPVSMAASLEFGFATSNYIICESVHLDVPWRQDCVQEGFEVDVKGRVVRPGTRPGLGIEINEKEVAKHPYQPEVLRRSFYKDGSVGDW